VAPDLVNPFFARLNEALEREACAARAVTDRPVRS
jgi:hypothetical protein